MGAQIIDGKAIAAKVREEVRREVDAMERKPGLATILVGDDPACELAELIRALNADERVHGILLQLPLPDHLNQDDFIGLIDPAKDVDGLTVANAGLLMHGRDEAL